MYSFLTKGVENETSSFSFQQLLYIFKKLITVELE